MFARVVVFVSWFCSYWSCVTDNQIHLHAQYEMSLNEAAGRPDFSRKIERDSARRVRKTGPSSQSV